jgi:hypothetical protein
MIQQRFLLPYRTPASLPHRLAAVAALLCLSAAAHAQNLLSDFGFESAGGGNIYYSGQSIDSGAWTVTEGNIYIDNQDPYVYAGNNAANLTYANLYVPNSLSQTVGTTVGDSYTLSFFADSDSPNSFAVTENGVDLTGLPVSIIDNGFPSSATDGNSSLFVDYTTSFIATSTSTDLSFIATADPGLGSPDGSVMIDNVVLEATPTPEPGSIVLALTGLVGLAGAAAFKRFGNFATSPRH